MNAGADIVDLNEYRRRRRREALGLSPRPPSFGEVAIAVGVLLLAELAGRWWR